MKIRYRYFYRPSRAALNLYLKKTNILVITQSSPLGKKLLGKFIDDEFEMTIGQHKKFYRISKIE